MPTKSVSAVLPALLVLAACCLLAMAGRGALESYAVFLLPLETAMAASRSQVAGVYSLGFVALGLSGPLVGILFDRFGPARIYGAGVLVAATALALASRAEALWQLYVATGLLLGAGVAMMGPVSHAALLSRWFTTRLGSALALSYASSALGMLAMAPYAQSLIGAFGWRGAWLAMAASLLALLPLVVLLARLRAGNGRASADGAAGGGARGHGPSLREALRHPAYWGLNTSFILTGFGMYAVAPHSVALLREQGFSEADAAWAYGAIGLAAPLGMLGFGWLGDRIGRRPAVLISYACTLAGVASLFLQFDQPSFPALIAFVILFGGTFGSRGPAITSIAASIFGGPHFGRIYGTITIAMGLGGAGGALLGGFWYDLTGGYEAGLVFSLLVLLLGLLPFALMPALAQR